MNGFINYEEMFSQSIGLKEPCYVHCRRPRIKCKDHKIRVVEAPWARKGSSNMYR